MHLFDYGQNIRVKYGAYEFGLTHIGPATTTTTTATEKKACKIDDEKPSTIFISFAFLWDNFRQDFIHF